LNRNIFSGSLPGMNTKPRPDPRREIGAIGERAVREEVTRIGWTLIDHNVRWREGELDIIALDGDTVVFIEVKTLMARAADRPTDYSPFESITVRKQKQIRGLAGRWLSEGLPKVNTRGQIRHFRFDAFAVTLDPDGSVRQIEHLQDAF
jgi:putative endonuclease